MDFKPPEAGIVLPNFLKLNLDATHLPDYNLVLEGQDPKDNFNFREPELVSKIKTSNDESQYIPVIFIDCKEKDLELDEGGTVRKGNINSYKEEELKQRGKILRNEEYWSNNYIDPASGTEDRSKFIEFDTLESAELYLTSTYKVIVNTFIGVFKYVKSYIVTPTRESEEEWDKYFESFFGETVLFIW